MDSTENKIVLNTKWAWGLLGTFATAVAFISFIQQIGEIPLKELPMRYLNYYREYMLILTRWIPLPFGWSISSWYADLMIIAAVLKVTYHRALELSPVLKAEDSDYYDTNSFKYKLFAQLALALDIFLKSLIAPLTIIYYLYVIIVTFIFTRDAYLTFKYQMGASDRELDQMYKLKKPQIEWLKTYRFLMVITLTLSVPFFLVGAKW